MSLAVNSSGDIFAGTNSGVFRSTDNGANWTGTNNRHEYSHSIYTIAINSSGEISVSSSVKLERIKRL